MAIFQDCGNFHEVTFFLRLVVDGLPLPGLTYDLEVQNWPKTYVVKYFV